MSDRGWAVLLSCVLLLLPMLPAVAIFKMFPLSRADGTGRFYGMKWKLGGAFAGYAFLLLVLYLFLRGELDRAGESQVWRIMGRVQLDPVGSQVVISTLPDSLLVGDDGTFTLRIAARTVNDDPELPAIVAKASDYEPRTVVLSNDTAFKRAPKLIVDKSRRTVIIEDPILVRKLPGGPGTGLPTQ